MDIIAEWTAAQGRVIDLVTAASPDRIEDAVPACPDWSARNLLSHLVGFAADVVDGDEPDDHNPEWTARQVEARQHRSVAQLVAEWRGLTSAMQSWMRANTDRPINDITIHEQDLRGGLGVTGGQDTDGAHFVRDRFAGRLRDAVVDLPVLQLSGEAWTWQSRDGEPEVIVSAPDADLARAIVSRRSEAQLRSWTTHGDVEPFLDHFAVLGSLPDHDLTETFG